MKKQLKDICTITMGQSPDSKTYNSKKNGLPFFQGNADFGEKYPTARVYCSEPKKIAESNDILISVRAPIGALNFSKEQCCIGRGLASLRVKETDLCGKEYLYAFLKSQNAELNRKGTGSTFSAIGKSALEDLIINLPTLSEQQKIASELDRIQSAIDNKKQQLSLLDEAVKSEFVEMFGENPVENGKWKVEKLGDCGTFKNGMNYSPNENGVDILCLNVSDFKDNYKIQDCKTLSSISLNEEPSSEYYLQNDDIVFVRSNGNKKLVGRCVALYPNDCKVLFSGFCIRFRKSTDNLNTDFLLHFFKTDLTREQLKGKGANIQNLNQQILANLHLPVPPLDLQNQFAAFVQQIDKSKSLVKQQIADLQELLDSKMQEYFG